MAKLVAMAVALALSMFGYAVDSQADKAAFESVQDIKAEEEPETTDQGESEPIWDGVYDEEETYYEEPYYEPYSGSDGFMQEGVRDGVDSDTETWYSSQARYHEDTAQWSVDDEGYYRTDEGYYVVASDDYEKGTVINTSKGEAQVLDDGTYSGNADFYVVW